MLNDRRAIPLAIGRQGYDKRGKDTRPAVLSRALMGGNQINLATANARGLVKATGGGKTVNWITQNLQADVAAAGWALVNENTLAATMNETWYLQEPDGFPTNDPIHSPPFVMASCPSGFEWNRNLFAQFANSPERLIIPVGPGVTTNFNNLFSKISLLDESGNVVKWCSSRVIWNFDYDDAAAPPENDGSINYEPFEYDTLGPVTRFFGIKLHTESSGLPDDGAPSVTLYAFESQVIG